MEAVAAQAQDQKMGLCWPRFCGSKPRAKKIKNLLCRVGVVYLYSYFL